MKNQMHWSWRGNPSAGAAIQEEFLVLILGDPKRVAGGGGEAGLPLPPGNRIERRGFGFSATRVNRAGVGTGPALSESMFGETGQRQVRPKDRIPKHHHWRLPTDVIRVALQNPPPARWRGGFPDATRKSVAEHWDVLSAATPQPIVISCLAFVCWGHRCCSPFDPGIEPCNGTSNCRTLVLDGFPAEGNRVDCAIARLVNLGDFLPNLRGLGRQNPATMDAFEHQTVKKSGMNAPGVTTGVVFDVSADFSGDYRQGNVWIY